VSQTVRAFVSWLVAPGRSTALALLALAIIGYLLDPLPLHHIRDRGFDTAQRLLPLQPGEVTVPIVTIDEESLAKLGQWPWPRSLIAELVRHIAAGKPAALGVDILFPEPDRFSPPKLAKTLSNLPGPLAEQLSKLPSTDDQLGEAFGDVATVLGEGPTNEPEHEPAAAQPTTIVRQFGADPRPFITAYASMIRSLPEIGFKARAAAALTSDADEDGIVRAVPLFTSLRGELIPSLGLQTLRVAIDVPSIAIAASKSGIERVELGPLSIPTDGRGRAYIHFGVPRPRYISAAEVLSPGFDARQFEDKIVLLGVTGLGLVDQKLTPMGLTQGIEVHADLIESILTDTLLHRPISVFWIELGLVLLAGLLISTLVDYRKPALAAATILGIAIMLVGSELAAFHFGWLVDGIYPAVVALLISGGILMAHLRAAQISQRQLTAELAHQRELAARTEGELAAARDLQLGLLPHRFPAFPDRPDIDLFARIEPARAVGGDFFDFTLIDAEHLFFIIADVSGKGVPAALFMEMTLQIVRASVQQHQCDLEQVMLEANAKTAAASLDMGENGDGMFVTAFAGIVNTSSGEVVYASAGHDSPYIVGTGGKTRQFATAGGPPFGVLDGYIYPVDNDRLELQQVMLLFTDGVTEAQDAAGELYSPRRLSAALETVPMDHARSVVDACFKSVQQFVRDAEQADDITVLAIRRAPPAIADETAAAA
jgi:serine phosphatase RsbU (regulator of sigma subunit)